MTTRNQQEATAYASLPDAERNLVRAGQIERGMDTNAVFLAWGKPSEVVPHLSPSGSDGNETWVYYGNRPVLTPRWIYLPTSYGYWNFQYEPAHHSQRYVKGSVTFQNGRVTEWVKH